MQDEHIVTLYWRRDEAAIVETERKYGVYLTRIAYRVLANELDSQEAVNDTYLSAWDSIPPHHPAVLATYLGKITRQLSIDAYRKRTSEKRRASEYAASLSELEECVSGTDTESSVDLRLLVDAISAYLRTVSPQARALFIARYFFLDTLREAAASIGMSESRAKSQLYRTRIGLKAYLEQEGFFE